MAEDRHQSAFDAEYREHTLARAIRAGAVDEWGIPYRSPLHRVVWWQSTEAIWRLLELDDGETTILNVGSGFGLDEKALRALHPAADLWGVDISTEMVAHALQNGCEAELAVASAEALPLPDGSFARVFSREVMEHVEHVDRYCEEIFRVARDQAIVVVTTPNARSMALIHLAERCGLSGAIEQEVDYKDEHLTTTQITSALERAGMTVEQIWYDCPAWFLLLDLDRTPLRRFGPWLARWLHPLAGTDRVARMLCDQVKVKAVVHKSPTHEPTEPFWRCAACGGRLEFGVCSACDATQVHTPDGAPLYVRPSTAGATPTTDVDAGQKRRFRAAFVLHSLVYLPTVVAACLIRRLNPGARESWRR